MYIIWMEYGIIYVWIFSAIFIPLFHNNNIFALALVFIIEWHFYMMRIISRSICIIYGWSKPLYLSSLWAILIGLNHNSFFFIWFFVTKQDLFRNLDGWMDIDIMNDFMNDKHGRCKEKKWSKTICTSGLTARKIWLCI